MIAHPERIWGVVAWGVLVTLCLLVRIWREDRRRDP